MPEGFDYNQDINFDICYPLYFNTVKLRSLSDAYGGYTIASILKKIINKYPDLEYHFMEPGGGGVDYRWKSDWYMSDYKREDLDLAGDYYYKTKENFIDVIENDRARLYQFLMMGDNTNIRVYDSSDLTIEYEYQNYDEPNLEQKYERHLHTYETRNYKNIDDSDNL